LAAVVDLPPLTSRVRWGVCVLDADGRLLAGERPEAVHRTASVGKLLLLVAVARGIDAGGLDPDEPLSRRRVEPVGDSGLWQHLRSDLLPLADVAALVGSVSDNLATNVLLDRIGLEAVHAVARDLGLVRTALHDRVRDRRGPEHSPTLSAGSARELAELVRQLPPLVEAWLSAGTDLSMVAAAFGLDPLAHAHADRGVRLVNKTGTDDGVRVDVGRVHGPAGGLSYAVLAEWDVGEDARDEVLAGMREIGLRLRRRVSGQG
jgi:beta-lactamase class A